MSDEESPGWTRALQPACAAIAALLHPYAEVVLHDLASDEIVGLWNAFSGRAVGDPSLLEELPASWRVEPVQGPYRKVLADGRELSSVSALISDERGRPRGLLCINLDRSPLLDASAVLERLARPLTGRPVELFSRDWREQIALTVDQHCRARGLRADRLTRDQRRTLVEVLDDQGLFATRHAAEHAARALGVSRATVYALLREVRDAPAAAGVSP